MTCGATLKRDDTENAAGARNGSCEGFNTGRTNATYDPLVIATEVIQPRQEEQLHPLLISVSDEGLGNKH